jgi:hypothetical protein
VISAKCCCNKDIKNLFCLLPQIKLSFVAVLFGLGNHYYVFPLSSTKVPPQYMVFTLLLMWDFNCVVVPSLLLYPFFALGIKMIPIIRYYYDNRCYNKRALPDGGRVSVVRADTHARRGYGVIKEESTGTHMTKCRVPRDNCQSTIRFSYTNITNKPLCCFTSPSLLIILSLVYIFFNCANI